MTQTELSTAVADILQGFQASMERQLSSIREKLGTIDSRMDALENTQKALEKEICIKSNVAGTSGQGRKRITPTALQVSVLYLCDSEILLFEGEMVNISISIDTSGMLINGLKLPTH